MESLHGTGDGRFSGMGEGEEDTGHGWEGNVEVGGRGWVGAGWTRRGKRG